MKRMCRLRRLYILEVERRPTSRMGRPESPSLAFLPSCVQMRARAAGGCMEKRALSSAGVCTEAPSPAPAARTLFTSSSSAMMAT